LLFQSVETFSKEPFPPTADDLAAAVEACRNFVVVQGLCGQQNHLGALNLKIR